uniref:NADP-dependent oxidoreductase domain-containing protein n=1 Tax=Vannella robusta TaxID=1487602 RepID=A0A7S4IDC5_9EUKA
MATSLSKCLTLRRGAKMPLFGLGTWLSKGDLCYEAVKMVLTKCDVRLLDTAAMYENEDQVGRAIIDSNVSRDEIFLVTKLQSSEHGYEQTKAAIKKSLERLQVDYVDLFLVHTPKGGDVVSTWKAMLEIRDAGLCKSVGVSNFGQEQLKQLAATGMEMPEVNQIELHVFLPQTELVQYCRDQGMQIMGYCPFARQKCAGNQALVDIGQKHGKTESQVMLRWSLQKEIITIPKSTTESHILQNCDVFGDWYLTDEEMNSLDNLANGFKASTSVNHQDIPWDEVK